MAKRFTDSEKWKDDWFLDLPDELKLFWLYLLDNCDHSGIWKPAKALVKASISHPIDFQKSLDGPFKGRVFILEDGKWFIPKFLKFQYPNGLSMWHSTTKGIIVRLSELKALERVIEAFGKAFVSLKDKDKDKDKDMSSSSLKGGMEGGGIKKFSKPTPEEVTAYAKEINFNLDGQKFWDYYESKGWVIGKSPMKNWKATIRTWKTNGYGGSNGKPKDVGFATAKPGKYPD